jgi:hypothetical protein
MLAACIEETAEFFFGQRNPLASFTLLHSVSESCRFLQGDQFVSLANHAVQQAQLQSTF